MAPHDGSTELCREKLDAVGRRHTDERPQNRAKYLRVLNAFNELVMNGRAPRC